MNWKAFWQGFIDVWGHPITVAVVTLTFFFVVAMAAYSAEREYVYRDRFCAGMKTEVRMANGTRADCLSARLAIEVDWADKWHQALGQAMSYSASTGHAPAIILVCRKKPKRCDRQFEQLQDAATFWKIPLTVWRCDLADASLDKCERVDRAPVEIGEKP
jgi:hypothetical protein